MFPREADLPLSGAFVSLTATVTDDKDDVPVSPIEVSQKPGLGQVFSLTKWTSR